MRGRSGDSSAGPRSPWASRSKEAAARARVITCRSNSLNPGSRPWEGSEKKFKAGHQNTPKELEGVLEEKSLEHIKTGHQRPIKGFRPDTAMSVLDR